MWSWRWWVGYLLEQLEIYAKNHGIINNYEQALVVLVDKIQNRIKGGMW